LSPQRALITGGSGFIGSHLVDRLIREGFEITVVDNLSAGDKEHLDSRASFHQLDICDPALKEVLEAERPDIVFHTAAQASVAKSVADPKTDATINVLGTLNLLSICSNLGIKRFIYSSTGGALYGNPEEIPCPEIHPIRPVSPYGASKYAAEVYIRAFAESSGLKYTILRYSNVYGPRQSPFGAAGVIAIFAQRMLTNKKVTIFGNGDQKRDFVYISDVVEANLKAVEQKENEEYNIGVGEATSLNTIVSLLAKSTGYTLAPTHEAAREGDVFKIALDNKKAKRLLGWSPKVDLSDGIDLTVDYFKNKLATNHAS
jgi:UDP-glucose 4-epimerase